MGSVHLKYEESLLTRVLGLQEPDIWVIPQPAGPRSWACLSGGFSSKWVKLPQNTRHPVKFEFQMDKKQFLSLCPPNMNIAMCENQLVLMREMQGKALGVQWEQHGQRKEVWRTRHTGETQVTLDIWCSGCMCV